MRLLVPVMLAALVQVEAFVVKEVEEVEEAFLSSLSSSPRTLPRPAGRSGHRLLRVLGSRLGAPPVSRGARPSSGTETFCGRV